MAIMYTSLAVSPWPLNPAHNVIIMSMIHTYQCRPASVTCSACDAIHQTEAAIPVIIAISILKATSFINSYVCNRIPIQMTMDHANANMKGFVVLGVFARNVMSIALAAMFIPTGMERIP